MKRLSFILLLLVGFASSVWGASVEPFIGEFRGRSISDGDAGLSKRDLSVTIKEKGEGFVVDWTTVTRSSSGKEKKKSYSVSFIPTKRANIFSSAMKTNVFGGRQALDPLKGDPYVWARIDGRTLTIYALIISDGGGYEMQTYERELTDAGMNLRFSRVSDGQILRSVRGVLERVD